MFYLFGVVYDLFGYKMYHGAETALCVKNYILTALDKKSGVFLTVIDISATFYTVNHTNFTQRLEGYSRHQW